MGTGDTRQDDAPAGGVGTITPPAGQPATGPAARPGERRDRRPGRPGQGTQPARGTGHPARTRPTPQSAEHAAGARGMARRAAQAAAPPGSHRMPFFLLLCGLLGGALVSALVISTTLAEGSFEITRLQQSNNALAKQRQMLQEEVAVAQSAQVIEERALKLGMRPAGELRFLDLKTGKVRTDAGGGAAAIDVPGYTP
jgi:hypothetical protein